MYELGICIFLFNSLERRLELRTLRLFLVVIVHHAVSCGTSQVLSRARPSTRLWAPSSLCAVSEGWLCASAALGLVAGCAGRDDMMT
jgi:hypothetical protein